MRSPDKSGGSSGKESSPSGNEKKQDKAGSGEKSGADNSGKKSGSDNSGLKQDKTGSGEKSGTDSSGEKSGTDSAGKKGGKDDSGAGSSPEKPESRGPVSDDNINYYYYTRISSEERLLYDAMLSLAQSVGGNGPEKEDRLVRLNPSSEEFSVSYIRAFNALVNDHPELFWISMSRAIYQCKYYVLPSFGGQYKVVFSLEYPEENGSADDQRAEYIEEQKQLRAAADALLERVDFTRSDADIALQLHDLLLSGTWYNRDAGKDDYAHTAYGALVTDSSGNPGGALCDGYALAYQYLLQRAGLTCAMISGYAGPSEDDLEKHAWNIVLLDNEWYEVDPTWDDIVLEISPSEEGYDILSEALSDESYMQRIQHYMYNRTTEEMRSFTPGDDYRYSSDNGWVTLLQPSVHIRFTDKDSENSLDYVTPLAPVAEGTLYSWDNLAGRQ